MVRYTHIVRGHYEVAAVSPRYADAPPSGADETRRCIGRP